MKVKGTFCHFFLWIMIMSASFDTFANIKIKGYSFRLCQFAAFFGFIVLMFEKGAIVFNKRWRGWILFGIINTVFIFNSPSIGNALGYGIWYWFDIFFLFVIYGFCINSIERCKWLISTFLNSFYYIAILSLVQFVLGVLGINFYIQQWWLGGKLPRVSGFSYEPSYFATYMIAGWTIYAYLCESEQNEFYHRNSILKFITISLAIIFSTSRMGWLMIAVWLCCKFVKSFLKFLRNKRIERNTLIFYSMIIIGILIGIVFLLFVNNYLFRISVLMNGMEVGGSSNGMRVRNAIRLLNIWRQSPVIGVSLGGISPALAVYRGLSLNGVVNINKIVAPINITAELLVATGIEGCIIFYYSFAVYLRESHRLNKRLLTGFVSGVLMVLIILQFNQNILRTYLWIDIAMLDVVIEYCRLSKFENDESLDTNKERR